MNTSIHNKAKANTFKLFATKNGQKYRVTTTKQFRQLKGGISSQALNYARDKELIDFIWTGRNYLVVLTDKSMKYTPKNHPNRV